MTSTIDYYNNKAQEFSAGTINADMKDTLEEFLKFIPQGGTVLDLGCGAGRDTKYFLDRGYSVTAIDGSEELCRLASEYTGIPVRHILFEELEDKECYDGIWACASLLHCSEGELPEVMQRVVRALKPKGVFYISFKYGAFRGEREGRYYTDMNEDSMARLLAPLDVKFVKQWISKDVRPGREDIWINVLGMRNA